MPAMYARKYLCWFIEPPASQVIEQRRDDPGEKEKSCAGERCEHPIEPRNAYGLTAELFEHLRPEVAAELSVVYGSDRSRDKFFRIFADWFLAHFAAPSGRRRLSFFRNIR